MFKRLEKWDMINVFLNGKSNVCSLFDDFFRNYVNLWNFCPPVIRVKPGKGDKAGCLKLLISARTILKIEQSSK